MSTIAYISRLGAASVLMAFCLTPSADSQARGCPAGSQKVTIDHRIGTVSPDGLITLRHKECFEIEIANTNTACILVNLEDIQTGLQARRLAATGSAVSFPVTHDESISAYKVRVDVKASCATSQPDLKALERLIPVETYGWTLGIAGAFTADGLTDPVFFLESGSRPKPDDPDTTETGFIVRKRSDAENDLELGAATFVHLYHNDPDRLGGRWINWVPLSFGLGIGNGSEARYYFGTGVRFGTRAFLTGGAVLGSRNRLPEKLSDGDFTTDQNALGSRPDKTEVEWFVSLSLRGLDIDVSKLSAPFKTSAPAP